MVIIGYFTVSVNHPEDCIPSLYTTQNQNHDLKHLLHYAVFKDKEFL